MIKAGPSGAKIVKGRNIFCVKCEFFDIIGIIFSDIMISSDTMIVKNPQ